jgi:hypothetical protein
MSIPVTFKIGDLRPLWEHALAAPEPDHRTDYDGEVTPPSLCLVHDRGIYMMSNGIPVLPGSGEDGHSLCVYADGYSPDDEDWWERARDAVGGDDFGEYLGADRRELVRRLRRRGHRHLPVRRRRHRHPSRGVIGLHP